MTHRPIVVVEGDSDAVVLKQLLSREKLKPIVAGAKGGSSAVSLARSLLAAQSAPVALVLDSDQSSPERNVERRRSMTALLGAIASANRWKLCMMEPDLERALLLTPGFAEAAIHRAATPEDLSSAAKAKKALPSTVLSKLPVEALDLLRTRHTDLSALLSFLREASVATAA